MSTPNEKSAKKLKGQFVKTAIKRINKNTVSVTSNQKKCKFK